MPPGWEPTPSPSDGGWVEERGREAKAEREAFLRDHGLDDEHARYLALAGGRTRTCTFCGGDLPQSIYPLRGDGVGHGLRARCHACLALVDGVARQVRRRGVDSLSPERLAVWRQLEEQRVEREREVQERAERIEREREEARAAKAAEREERRRISEERKRERAEAARVAREAARVVRYDIGMARCAMCSEWKTFSEFTLRSTGRPASWCKPCSNAYSRAKAAERNAWRERFIASERAA